LRWRRALMVGGIGLFGTALLAAAAVCLGSGCSSLGFYAQAAGGHLDLLQRARSVADAVADPATPEALRQRLQLSQQMRDFAVRELQLPDNDSYRRYADLQREAVVWNVVAAPALGLTLKTWCFPVMGCVGYRGYFDQAQAQALAAQLRTEGWEVDVYGVPAYSTLGWSNWVGGDPLLNTFIRWPEGSLAQLIFHELAHQVAYAPDDTTFNESFAVAVERLGVQRWLAQPASLSGRSPEELARVRLAFEQSEARRGDFRTLTLRYRVQLQAVYQSPAPEAERLVRKAQVMAALRADYETLKVQRWGGFNGYDSWVAKANNASFGVQAAYNELVPEFETLFERQGRDFKAFYAAVQTLAGLPKDQRRAKLATP